MRGARPGQQARVGVLEHEAGAVGEQSVEQHALGRGEAGTRSFALLLEPPFVAQQPIHVSVGAATTPFGKVSTRVNASRAARGRVSSKRARPGAVSSAR